MLLWQSVESWPSASEAAATLGTSLKTIARYGEQGKIEIRKRPRTGKKPENVCNPRDVEKLIPKAHVMTDDSEAWMNAPMGAVARRQPAPDMGAVNAIMRTIATAIETERKSVETPKLWLSLEEAAAYSGLSRHFLRENLVAPENYTEGENIIGVNGGPHGAWRIQRAALEAFEG